MKNGMRLTLTLFVATLALGLSACQTRSHTEDGTPIVRTPTLEVPFVPQTTTSRLSFVSGNYPLLFSGGCEARWISNAGEADMALPAELPAGVTDRFHVIQLSLESSFADMSIAYDVVGLRGMQTYLQTQSGARIMPAQIVMSANLTETPQGALKVFRRNNYLLFPKEAVVVAAPVGSPGKGVQIQLRVEGLSTIFAATFSGHMPSVEYEPTFSNREGVQKVKRRSLGILETFQFWSHTFD